MVIGNGSIAKIFFDKFFNDSSIVIFASGVSNSNESENSEFEREINLMRETISSYPNTKIIYFSSVYVDYIETKYYQHKKNMELVLLENCKNYLIIRLPQVISNSGNKNNLVNYIVNSITNDDEIHIQKNVKRSIIDIDDIKSIAIELLKNYNNKIFKVSTIESLYVIDICNLISQIKKKPPRINLVQTPHFLPEIQNSYEVNQIIDLLKIDKQNYTNKTLKKYITQ